MTRNRNQASPPLETARGLLEGALRLYRKEPLVAAELHSHLVRLDEPLRVALVGSIKAGKSTLLNALLGEHVAPTDARECTRVVTWYRHGPTPRVNAHSINGRTNQLPVLRQQDRLELELGTLQAETLDRIEITWPAESLADLILIDTPGTASLSTEVSVRTQDFLAPLAGVSGVDAVIYMLRSLHTSDVEFLRDLSSRTGHGGSSIGSIAVLSRADELGGGRLDTMLSVNKAVNNLRADPALDGLVEAIVPVAGLLALASSTMRQSEFSAFVALEKVPRREMQELLLSADRFISSEDERLPSARTRASLVERFGLYGIRLAIATLRTGITDAPTLSAELVRRSGLDEVRRVLDIHFRQRNPELKAHSAILATYRLLMANPREGAKILLETAEEYLANSHAFREMRLISRVRSGHIGMDAEDVAELTRLVGGSGIAAYERLGAEPGATAAELSDIAHATLWKWASLAENPLTPRETAEACRIAVRSCEGIVAELGQPVPLDA